jgi:hypothetical protein
MLPGLPDRIALPLSLALAFLLPLPWAFALAGVAAARPMNVRYRVSAAPFNNSGGNPNGKISPQAVLS